MRLNLINPDTLELEGVLTLYESVQWTTCYNSPDAKFQINCGMQYFNKVRKDMYVENSDDPEHIGVIKKIQTLRSNEKESIQITGIMLEKDILSHRVAKGVYTYMDVMPTFVIYNLMYQAMFETVELSRKMPNLGTITIPNDDEIPDMELTNYSSKYPNLSNEVYALMQNIDLGFRAKLNKTTKKIDLEFYAGTDHTERSNDPIVLSRNYGTALEVDYSIDSSQNITNLIAIGEDNVYVEVQRGTPNGNQMIEKSMDISGEIPWPTYSVEKPNEDGGQYFRYKKVTPDGFISNQDIWEKYNVDRIETTHTRYREVTYTEQETMSVADAVKNYPNVALSAVLDKKAGLLVGSAAPTAGVVNAVSKSLSKVSSGKKTVGYSISTPPEPTNTSLRAQTFSLKSKSKSSSKTKTKKSPVKSKVNSAGAVASASTDVTKLVAKMANEQVTIGVEKSALQSYQVTIVTYEDRDFVEYVYVDPGNSPSEATKVIEGSVASGNVMMYENFEENKVELSIYKDALTKAANSYLNTFITSESIDVKLYPLSNQRFRHEYNLGDILTAKDKEIGFATDLRVTSVTEIWDSKGYSVSVTLGTNVPSLTNRIKFLSKGGN